MLHIVKQFMFGLTGMLKCEFAGETLSGSNNDVTISSRTEFITKEVADSVNQIRLTEKIESTINTRNQIKDLNNGIIKFQKKESGNHISKEMKNDTIFMETEMTRDEAISHMNRVSLEKILRSTSAAEIVKAISSGTEKYEVPVLDNNGNVVIDSNNKEKTKTRLNFNGLTGSYSEAEDWLESDKIGYDSDGYFGGLEMNAIYTYSVEIMKNQTTAKNNDSQGKFNQLIDFDGNGYLQKNMNFYMGELEANHLDKGTNFVGDFSNLYENIGLNQSELEAEMTTNFFTAQEKFKIALSTALLMGIKPAELFVKGGLKTAFNEMYSDIKTQQEIIKEHETEILFVQGAVETALSNLTDGKLPNLKQESSAIALESVMAIFGGAKGVAANFDITNFTKNLVDDLSVGWISGQFGVIISRDFFEDQLNKYDVNLSAGLLNIIIPIISVSGTILHEKFSDEEVINATGDDYKISAFASISTIGKAVGVQYNEMSHETSAGIESKGEELTTMLSKMISALNKDNDAINPIQLKEGEQGQELLDSYFELLKNIEINNNIKGERKYMKNAVDAIVQSYKDKLYRYTDSNGIDFASAGIGVAFAADIMPLPFITASFEKVNTHFNSVDHSCERERATTEKDVNIASESYIKIVNHNENKVLEFDNKYQISIPNDYILQAKVSNEKLYLGGEIQNIRIHEHVTNNEVIKTIVIGEGKLDKNGLYIATNEAEKITSDINLNNKSVVYTPEIAEVIQSTAEIRKNINDLFSNEVITDPDTKGATALQRNIFNTFNSVKDSKSIMQLGADLLVLVNKHMDSYAAKIGKTDKLIQLKEQLSQLTDEKSIRAILQSVQSNFMEKNALEIGDKNIVNLKEGKKIGDYDKDKNGNDIRGKFFDKIFTEKYGSDFAGAIKIARNTWLDTNGEKNSYTFQTVSDGNLAMTGVKLGNIKKPNNPTGVMPYEGVYNIAEVKEGVTYIDLPKSKDYINNLPNNFLENIQTQLQEVGVDLEDLEGVKSFINNGGDDTAKIDYKLAFARMGECLNDAIILKEFNITAPSGVKTSVTSTMNTQKTDVDTYGIVIVDQVRNDITTVETQDGYAYTSPDGSVTIVVDTTGVVVRSTNDIIPANTNISALNLVDLSGTSYTQQANMVIKYIKTQINLGKLVGANIVQPLVTNDID